MVNETQKGDAAEGVRGASEPEPVPAQPSPQAIKRPYAPPKLSRLGSVAELTAGASAHLGETKFSRKPG
jgi:hypothetical protein